MKLRFFVSLLCVLFTLLFFTSWTKGREDADTPVHQLRIYEIPKENRKVFNERFRDHAHRIMKKYGFKIVAIWETEKKEKLEFVYLLEWKDLETLENGWQQFMADQEWKDIKKQTSEVHGRFVNSIEDKHLILTEYSPNTSLLTY